MYVMAHASDLLGQRAGVVQHPPRQPPRRAHASDGLGGVEEDRLPRGCVLDVYRVHSQTSNVCQYAAAVICEWTYGRGRGQLARLGIRGLWDGGRDGAAGGDAAGAHGRSGRDGRALPARLFLAALRAAAQAGSCVMVAC